MNLNSSILSNLFSWIASFFKRKEEDKIKYENGYATYKSIPCDFLLTFHRISNFIIQNCGNTIYFSAFEKLRVKTSKGKMIDFSFIDGLDQHRMREHLLWLLESGLAEIHLGERINDPLMIDISDPVTIKKVSFKYLWMNSFTGDDKIQDMLVSKYYDYLALKPINFSIHAQSFRDSFEAIQKRKGSWE